MTAPSSNDRPTIQRSAREDAPPLGPLLIETEEEGRIAERLPDPLLPAAEDAARRASPLRLGLYGLAVLAVGLVALDIAGFVVDQFARSPVLGWATAGVAAGGLGAVVAWILAELRQLRRLRRLPEVQGHFAAAAVEGQPRQVILAALEDAGAALGQAGPVRARLAAWRRQVQPHHGNAQAIDLFERTVLRPLDADAERATWRAVGQVFAINVVSPSATIDTLAFIARSLRLVREVAAIYGHRPGLAGTRHLVGRILLNASFAGTANAVAHFGTRMVGHWMARFAGDAVASGLAAQRMQRIGRLAMIVCRPVPLKAADEPVTSTSPNPSSAAHTRGG
ncbi:TIGR01620 family protein [Allostella vacuolata]|nr:TIGR01620 family protein [Stella vacuolata]